MKPPKVLANVSIGGDENCYDLIASYREDYSKIISRNFTEKFIKNYKGHMNLNEDPDKVKERWSELNIIFDTILNLKF